MNKRAFMKLTAGFGAMTAMGSALASNASVSTSGQQSNALQPITGNVKPISKAEHEGRIKKAQQLMVKQGLSALVIEPGASMTYFSGMQWWRSERLTALVIPQEGQPAVVTPFFEAPSVKESLAIDAEVRVWQEHESPFVQVNEALKARKLDKGKIGFENTVRYFVLNGLMSLMTKCEHVPAEPVILGCRMYKSTHELELMHKANEVTLKAYEHVYSQLEIGMAQSDVKQIMAAAQQQLGGSSIWGLVLFNEASAYPHGTSQKQVISEGSTVLMDCGCAVHGYQSDISRTWVFGEPSKKQREVWNAVHKGQQIAFEKAQNGTPTGKVDDAVREYYETLGYGPAYALPGLSHRTGHGIGMEGHEKVNFVHGETTKLAPGMCLSNEPGIYIPGEFGVRLEDCLYMTESGPAWFTEPPESLDKPLGRLSPMA
ncbi:M24 family metallopeptidase [Alteromonas confluentis]